MDRVLVTGANGCTGSRLANELALRGYQVLAFVRRNADLSLLDQALLESGKLVLVYGDLCDRESVDHAIRDVRYVFHIAALYRAARFPDQAYWDVNVAGTQHILEAAQRAGVERVLHCSTIGVHGGVEEIPAHEKSDFAPSDIYQITKLEGEKLAQAAIARGEPVTVVRPAGIYGPGDTRFLKLFSMVHRGRFIMFGSGETLMHMVFLDDLVRGMIQAVEHPDGRGETFILAGDEYVTLNRLVRLVAAATGGPQPWLRFPLWPLMTAAACCEYACKPLNIEPPLHRRRAAFFTKHRAFSIAHAQERIGYQPQVELADGLRRTADWYREQGWLSSRFS